MLLVGESLLLLPSFLEDPSELRRSFLAISLFFKSTSFFLLTSLSFNRASSSMVVPLLAGSPILLQTNCLLASLTMTPFAFLL